MADENKVGVLVCRGCRFKCRVVFDVEADEKPGNLRFRCVLNGQTLLQTEATVMLEGVQ